MTTDWSLVFMIADLIIYPTIGIWTIVLLVRNFLKWRAEQSCYFRTNGGMRCSAGKEHDGPHTFTSREWKRTRNV